MGVAGEISSQEVGTMLTPVLPQSPGDAHSRHLIDVAGGEVPYGSRVPCLHAAWVCHVTSLDLGFLICKMRDFPEMKSPLSPDEMHIQSKSVLRRQQPLNQRRGRPQRWVCYERHVPGESKRLFQHFLHPVWTRPLLPQSEEAQQSGFH